jgi:hypothetical protein
MQGANCLDEFLRHQRRGAAPTVPRAGNACVHSLSVPNVLLARFACSGRLSIVERPIRAYAVSLSTSARQFATQASPVPRLSLSVLPFANLGGGSEQDYFVDGVTESLTTDLSRISGACIGDVVSSLQARCSGRVLCWHSAAAIPHPVSLGCSVYARRHAESRHRLNARL